MGSSPPTASEALAGGEVSVFEELDNAKLAQLLAISPRLTKAEWASCNINSLHAGHFIRVGEVVWLASHHP